MVGVFPLTRINQIALVVRDLDAVMRRYWEMLGNGPWVVYTYGPPLVREITIVAGPRTTACASRWRRRETSCSS